MATRSRSLGGRSTSGGGGGFFNRNRRRGDPTPEPELTSDESRATSPVPLGNLVDPPRAPNMDSTPEVRTLQSRRIQAMKDVADLEYIEGMPVAALFLDLLAKITKHDAALGINEADMTVQSIATAFRMQAEADEAKRKLDVQQSSDMVKKDLLDCELNSYIMNAEFAVPTEFAEHPSLTTPQRKKEAIMNFPPRHKFTGVGSKDGIQAMTLEEFLGSMGRAQRDMNLSRQEFHDQLVNCSTGKAHALLLDWLDNDESTESIYHLLSVNFDRRISPESAKTQLRDFKVQKDHNLAKIESLLTQLSSRAVSTLPPGESRKQLQNMEAIQALTRSLPPYSQNIVSTQYSLLSARRGKPVTFQELMRGLNIHRAGIDADIKSFGVDPKKNQGNQNKNPAPAKNNNQKKGKPTFGAFAVEMAPRAGQPQENRQQAQGEGKKKPDGKKYDGKRKGEGNPRPYCSLCGLNNHTAIKGCRNMLDDKGVPVLIDPVQSTCTACPPHIQPRLNHPSRLCPWRPLGIWHKKK
jgi:hypothetical protein